MKLRHPKLFLVTCAAVGLSVASSQAQTTLSGDHIVTGDLSVGTTGTTGNLLVTGDMGNSAPPGLKVTGDGGVVFTGSLGVGQIPVTGAGTRLMWHPKKGALRVGTVTGNLWNDSYIGENSIAFGTDASASGNSAFAVGSSSVASGTGSFSAGRSIAAGNYSVALGDVAEAYGHSAVSLGTAAAYGIGAVAMGESTWADANWSVAIGNTTSAFGESSMAVGEMTLASGDRSVALGYMTAAYGQNSTAMGTSTSSDSYTSFAIGRFNIGGGNSSSWVDTDPLLEVGYGSGNPLDPIEVRNRNALTVYKNGNVVIPKRQGDVPMGEFGNPE